MYDELFKLKTALLLEFWSSILQKTNSVTKSLQKVEVDIKTSILLLKSLKSYVVKLRTEELFNNFEEKGKALIQSCAGWETINEGLTFNV